MNSKITLVSIYSTLTRSSVFDMIQVMESSDYIINIFWEEMISNFRNKQIFNNKKI